MLVTCFWKKREMTQAKPDKKEVAGQSSSVREKAFELREKGFRVRKRFKEK